MAAVDNFEILKNIFIFSAFDMDALSSIHALCVEESLKKGESVFWEGDPPHWLLILKRGKVKLFKQSPSGKETILRIVDAGETFGEIALFDGRAYPLSAKTMEAAVILKIPRLEFLAMVRRHPNVSYEIILELSRRLRESQEVIQGLAVERVERRIVNLLLKLADRIGREEGKKTRIPVILTRQDIADMVGSTVETTIRIISRLSKEGIIETKGKTIYIKDMERLQTLPEELV
ncbi:MAG: Crp/Fnr family transcriptional regulator [Deltaproteobacteria bacterium]|nr:Crp/Fnr family transcriptional regulator [Deltaproteobacteria bacterium]